MGRMIGTGCIGAMVWLLAAGCGGGPEYWDALAVVPDFPVPSDRGVVDVEQGSLSWAGMAERCAGTGGTIDTAGFVLGEMPLAALDGLCGVSSPAGRARLLGDLYLSGYFGGLWLADVMGGMGGSPMEDGDADAAESDPVAMADNLASEVAARLAVVDAGNDAEMTAQAKLSIGFLLFLYGYNRGYVAVALENPPPGLVPPDGVMNCVSFLDCASPRLAGRPRVLDRFRTALAALADPPSARWRELARKVESAAGSTEVVGRDVWEGILADQQIDAGRYGMLLDLSVGYLLAGEAAVLGVATGYGNQDPDAARCGLLLDAGLYVWSNAYFLGLQRSAGAGPDDFPRIICIPGPAA